MPSIDAIQEAGEENPPLAPRGWLRPALIWLAGALLAERERWPLWLPVLMGTGIGLYFAVGEEPPLWLGPAALLGAVLAALAAWRRGRHGTVAIACVALALGFAAAQLQSWLVAAPVLERRLGPVNIEGRLVAIDPLPEGARVVVAPAHIDRLAPEHLPARLRLRLRHAEDGLLPGDWIRIKAMLLPPPGPAMPGAYDFQRRAWFDRLGAVGFALGAPQQIEAPAGEGAGWWRHAVEALRTRVTQRIRAVLPDSSGAIAGALIAGETHAIAPEDAGAFRDAGLAHILVIAGLHMGMVAGIAFFVLRAFFALIPAVALRYNTKKWAAALTLLVIFVYMLLSGATVSSRRAFVMTGLALLAVLVDRLSLSPRAVAFAAAAIMLMTPEAATGPSFQMSFAAVACLVAFYEAMRPRLSAWHLHAGPLRRAVLYLVAISFTTIVTTLATAPFTIYHFNRFPVYSITANALAVPITGFWVMPWAIVAVLLMPLHLEALPLIMMSKGIAAISAIAHHVTAWPGAVVTMPSMSATSLGLTGFGGLWLCIWLGRWRWLGLAPIVLGLFGLVLIRPPDLLVSDNARLIAVRAPDGAYLPSSRRGAKLVEETWTRRAAAELGAAWPASGSLGDGALQCDALVCRYRIRGRVVALLRNGSALAAACDGADLVVSPVAVHGACPGPMVIDPIDTWRKGGHAVWLDSDAIRIETVRDWQGERPWTVKHGK